MSDSPSHTVLIVDDHEINRRLASLFLQPLGWRAVMAINGAQALDIAAVQHFDVILMDMIMPGMDGLQTTASLRQSDGPNRDTPVIAVTGMENQSAQWHAVGVTQILLKPFDPDQLIAAVTEAIAQKPNGYRISA
ncbi:response regulator [Asticcacaulis excentricus]|uniref:Sensor histidine kinase/response regulator n=1 Tax=Asticcacaulis excentricus TaxID=78587 RepID=A0A3G9G6H9_9CAUL|nr:response regulator [Asticcacaulis excentricus]BBF81441.1 sensor histidine kinase/response regulator [Asticcacaulis excentricus]